MTPDRSLSNAQFSTKALTTRVTIRSCRCRMPLPTMVMDSVVQHLLVVTKRVSFKCTQTTSRRCFSSKEIKVMTIMRLTPTRLIAWCLSSLVWVTKSQPCSLTILLMLAQSLRRSGWVVEFVASLIAALCLVRLLIMTHLLLWQAWTFSIPFLWSMIWA